MSTELERFEPTEQRGRLAYEHLHRYAICRDFVVGKRVLDLACGTGYGSHILAQSAASVIGVDIDEPAIGRARQRYTSPNLKYQVADCYALPFPDHSFDVVVANEMIEHVHDQRGLVSEARRVLTEDGVFLVSTPNKPVYNRYKPPNAFHVSELEIPQFEDLLSGYFSHVRLTALRMALVSVGYELNSPDHGANLASAKLYRASFTHPAKPEVGNTDLDLSDPEYVLAMCSNRPMRDLPFQSSVLFARDEDLWLEHEKIMAWASGLHQEDEKLRADLRQAVSSASDARAELEAAKAGFSASATGQHVALSSKLLGRMVDHVVGSDPVDIVEGMFELNERLIRQDQAIEHLTAARDQSNAEKERLSADRAQLEAQNARLAAAREQLEAENSRLTAAREQLEAANKELGERRAEAEAALARSADELLAQKAELDREKALVARHSAELENLKRNSGRASTPGPRESQLFSALKKQRRRFRESHHEVRQQLSAASVAIRPALAASQPPSSPRRSRFAFASSFETPALFDRSWIHERYPNTPRLSYRRYIRDPRYHGLDTHPLFSAAFYLENNPDVAQLGSAPLQHYLEHGWREGRDPHPFFTNDWYLAENPDVLEAGIPPLEHYVQFGWREGRWPNPVFDPAAYLDLHVDVKKAGLEPLSHYLRYGMGEDRVIPFRGYGQDWRSLATLSSGRGSIIDYLVRQPIDLTPDEPGDAPPPQGSASVTWPPAPLNNHSIPQRLRDLLVSTGREEKIPLFSYFYSLMDAYTDCPEQFPESDECRQLLARIGERSANAAATGSSQPDASIIVPVYNNFLDTILCIAAVIELDTERTYELIVADDASNDAVATIIPQIGGAVRHVRQAANVGFLENCNAGSRAAKGRFIVLLNNDTLVLPDWLDSLARPFEDDDSIGLVGSKLLNWDGSLQEAGGIFWNDGSAWNFGRGQDATEPQFNYLKDVDYVSGASIAIPAAIWTELGGFDVEFGPAYCEDSDLAFRLRDAGYRTVYNPASEVIHHEGRSHGRDVNSGIKAYQVRNQARLVERWGGLLARDHFPNGNEVLRARDRSKDKPHLLMIDHYVPQWDRDAGSRTVYQYLQIFIDLGWQVTFWPDNLHRDPLYTPVLQGMGVEVITGPEFIDGFEDFIRNRADLYDVVFISRPHVSARYAPAVRTLTNARIFYYGHDLHFRRMEAGMALGGSVTAEAIAASREIELAACREADVIFYPDAEEVSLVRELVGGQRKFLTNPVSVYDSTQIDGAVEATARIPSVAGNRMLFVGGFNHLPNREGIIWFGKEVMPLILQRIPDANLDIVGSNAPAEVIELASSQVSVLGLVSDQKLADLYGQSAVAVAPLLHGAGVKGKVIEAMALAVPVATTSVGAQGIASAANLMFVGDSPQDLADAVVLAMTDRAEAQRRARAAVEFIRSHYGRESLMNLFRQLTAEFEQRR